MNKWIILGLMMLSPAGVLGQIDVIDQSGQLKIEPTYQGQLLSSLTGANFDVLALGGGRGGHLSTTTPSLTWTVNTGTKGVQIISNSGTMASSSVQVLTNTLTTWAPELSGAMGLVQGIIRVNGSLPPAGQYGLGASYANTGIGATGFFRFLLPAGSHTAILNSQTGEVHRFTFTVTANQEVNLGSIAALDEKGNLQISPRYQGQPLSSLTGANFDILALGGGNGTHLSTSNPTVTWTVQAKVWGTQIISNGGTQASAQITVTNGGLTAWEPELSNAMGLVRGIVRVNGNLPPANQYGIYASYASTGLSGTGSFRFLLPSGAHQAQISGPNGQIHSFSFSVVANQENDLGTITAVDQQGDLKIEPTYKNQSVSALTGAAFDLLAISGAGPGGHLSTTIPSMMWKVQARTISPYIISNGGVQVSATLTVTPNSLTTYSPELSAVMGLVRGQVRINGATPTPGQYSVYASYANSALDATGVFRMLLPAGAHTGAVNGPLGTLLTFPFTVIAGQEIDLGSPGSMAFLGTITGRGGTLAARTYNVSLKNTSALAFLSTSAKLIVTHLSGQACSPSVSAPSTIGYGDFAGGATIVKTFTSNFTGCLATGANASRFKVELQITSGATSTTITVLANTTL